MFLCKILPPLWRQPTHEDHDLNKLELSSTRYVFKQGTIIFPGQLFFLRFENNFLCIWDRDLNKLESLLHVTQVADFLANWFLREKNSIFSLSILM